MANLGSLVVSLEANIARFETDLGRAEQVAKVATDRISGFASDAMSALKGMAAGFAAAYTFDAILGKAKDTIAMAANFKDLAEKTGASVEQLSALARTAKMSNTSIETMEGGLIRMSKALAGADDEAKGAAHALDVLGLSQKELQSLSPVEAMKKVADALAEYRDGSGKTALAMDLFGRSGAQLLPMLKELAEQESLVGRITAEQAELADKYEKSIMALSAASGDFARNIAMTVLPALSSWAQQMSEGVRIAGGFWSALVAGATINPFKSQHENIQSITADMARMKQEAVDYQYFDEKAYERKRVQLEMLKSQQRQSALESTQGMAGRLDARDPGPKPTLDGYQSRVPEIKTPRVKVSIPKEVNSAFDTYLDQLDKMIKRQEESEYAAMQQNAVILASKEGIDQLSSRYQKATDLIDRYREAMERTQLDRYAEAVRRESDEFAFQTAIMHRTADEQDRLTIARRNALAVDTMILQAEQAHRPLSIAAQEQLRKLSEDSTASMLRDLDARRAAEEDWTVGATRAYEAYQERTRNVAKTTEDLFTNAYQGIENAMAEFLFNPWQKGVGSMLATFGQALQRMIAQAVAADLSRRLIGASGPGGRGLLGLFSGGATVSGAGTATENWIDSGGLGGSAGGILGFLGSLLPKFDVGTDYVPRDMIAKIHQGERIIPASQNTGAGGHSITIYQTVNGQSPAHELRRSGGAMARDVLNAINLAGRYA